MYPSNKFPSPPWGIVYDFLQQSSQCTVIAVDPEGYPQPTIIPFRLIGSSEIIGGTVEVHLVKGDATLAALAHQGRATIFVDQPLSLVPHTVFDARDTNRTMLLFRAVRLSGTVNISSDPTDIATGLDHLAQHLFPNEERAPVTIEHYGERISRLAHVTLSVETVDSKWKLGQDQPETVRQRLLHFLTERNHPLDQITVPILEDYWARSS